jgi:hypothetical protein
MTEAEWLACTDPRPMLEFLRGKATERKLRLTLCGWSRLNWKWLPEQSRSAVELAELYAEGLAGEADREAADVKLWLDTQERHTNFRHWLARLTLVQNLDLWATAHESASVNPRGRDGQVSVMKDLFNPFRPVTLGPAWLAWNGGTVPKLAQAIYDERAYDRLPILADALEEAGCNNADIVSHLRGPGPHVRGCWALDLILGKQ